MPAERLNPPDLYTSVEYGFSHAVVATGRRTVHCAGQVAWDRNHNLVGEGDVAAQAQQALSNLKAVLAAAGATPADVVRLRTFIVDYSPDKLGAIAPAIGAFYGDALPAANTVVGVQALALPGFLIEIEANAVID
jgi:enamine deaminase RidA (YjgF/YER057c/UK114 family)